MPKFKRPNPKKSVGLNLRAVIEGELMSRLPLPTSYEFISKVVDAIEKRIQDGPSDWLSLSNGTTFDKSWVPENVDEEPVVLESVQPAPPVERWPEFVRGHIETVSIESLENINREHEKRVAAHKLEKEIQAHEDWLDSERENRLS